MDYSWIITNWCLIHTCEPLIITYISMVNGCRKFCQWMFYHHKPGIRNFITCHHKSMDLKKFCQWNLPWIHMDQSSVYPGISGTIDQAHLTFPMSFSSRASISLAAAWESEDFRPEMRRNSSHTLWFTMGLVYGDDNGTILGYRWMHTLVHV